MNKTEKLFEVIENNQLVNVIRNGFVGAIPFLLAGAFSLCITAFPLKAYQTFITGALDGAIFEIFTDIYIHWEAYHLFF